jgi:recombination protein RecT
MANDLAIIEKQLIKFEPHFAQVLAPLGMSPARIIRTVMVSIERTPKLLDCSQQSILNGAMSAACLGLEVDGYTGQAFLIPFKEQGVPKAQLVIGYKGFNTMGDRGGRAISGSVVREGDEFEYDLGQGIIRHKPKLDRPADRKIIAVWAKAAAVNRPPVIEILSIDEILAVKAKSPGARKPDSPWNDPPIGFPAMAGKTAKRRLSRSLPLNTFVLGAAMDETFEERGKYAYIHPDKGLIVEGEVVQPLTPVQTGAPHLQTPRFAVALSDESERVFPTVEQWEGFMRQGFGKLDRAQLEAFMARNRERLNDLRSVDEGAVFRIIADYDARLKQLGSAPA